jgi:hypothetical protein
MIMSDTPSSPLRLDAFQSDNWSSSATPVAILNTQSTLHERIAYCWGLANQLHVLSDFLAQHENPEIQQAATLFGSQLQPLVTMLKKLGSDTQPGGPSLQKL